MGRAIVALFCVAVLIAVVYWGYRFIRWAWGQRPGQWKVVRQHQSASFGRPATVGFVAKKGYAELDLGLKVSMEDPEFEQKIEDAKSAARAKVVAMNSI